ncbi:YlxR family protein [Acaryochloris thomasi]|uniref:YlxR family protein n=1 Tax=Acaryochloris thomasi TaxID=2929456 RepID=UPI000DA67BE6|nr:YlxR family protein [Acaryochloris thomasi]
MEPNYRRCICCRKVAPKQEFWRVVRVHPDRSVQLDHGMGRSAYLCAQADCLRLAQKKNRLGRALRASVPDSIYQTLQERLTEGDRILKPLPVSKN